MRSCASIALRNAADGCLNVGAARGAVGRKGLSLSRGAPFFGGCDPHLVLTSDGLQPDGADDESVVGHHSQHLCEQRCGFEIVIGTVQSILRLGCSV
ncbi:hypothetical protein AB9F26_05980 [Falsihalocynthiibacter sp. BN13B15]|uniref:hypothetical protein n=1 Tax=Falsihalocynthiibacter sp. BN13B15 TaxID=3240871 RepID=UPI00350F6663